MSIEFYNKQTGEVIAPFPDHKMYVVDGDGDVLLVSFNYFGDPIDELLVKSDLAWRVIEEEE